MQEVPQNDAPKRWHSSRAAKRFLQSSDNEAEDQNKYKQILLAIEAQSEHPLAEAVVNHLKNENIEKAEIASFESITGMGVKAKAKNGSQYYVGNHKLMLEKNIQIDASLMQTAESLEEQAKTVIFLGNEKQVLAILAIADKIKETSKKAIETLQDRGIEVYMLTGDNNKTASAVAKQVGISNYQGEVMPSEKAAFVEKLQAEVKIVAMVGDGINDSHALAQANVSIAMGKGSDIAMDVAKMTLITSDLQSIPKALELSKRTVLGIRQNLFWAFAYNTVGIPLAALGFLSPMIAGGAMAFSSVSVLGNALLLRRWKPRA